MQTKNQNIVEASLKKTREQLFAQTEQLQERNSELTSELEVIQRDLFTKTELLKIVEDQHCVYVRRLRDEHKR